MLEKRVCPPSQAKPGQATPARVFLLLTGGGPYNPASAQIPPRSVLHVGLIQLRRSAKRGLASHMVLPG